MSDGLAKTQPASHWLEVYAKQEAEIAELKAKLTDKVKHSIIAGTPTEPKPAEGNMTLLSRLHDELILFWNSRASYSEVQLEGIAFDLQQALGEYLESRGLGDPRRRLKKK